MQYQQPGKLADDSRMASYDPLLDELSTAGSVTPSPSQFSVSASAADQLLCLDGRQALSVEQDEFASRRLAA